MRTKISLAGALLACGVVVFWVTNRPHLIIALETEDGKGSLIYHCPITTDVMEAKTRAAAAHTAFQSRLSAITNGAGAQAQAAMQAANISGNIPNLDMIGSDLQAQARALQTDIEAEFNCKVEL
ncbi:hypothetical protein GCM10010873_29830 [Cypionkella aquatica]|uniref:Uncharacterized protein n=2 Tax=Cypionkella aquatica TaxID=1756042 RepID=A0AA37X2D2_9RHOB|nr:hypothetical protein GCM10010873_29830 [Cypionkella aquatica]